MLGQQIQRIYRKGKIMQKYKVLMRRETSSLDVDLQEFETRVEKLLQEGWSCSGGVAYQLRPDGRFSIAQALIKTKMPATRGYSKKK